MGGIGPGPHACMILADLGADIVRIDRPAGTTASGAGAPDADFLLRHRRRLTLNAQDPEDLRSIHLLLERADVVVDVFRPGVMERLGLGPQELRERNPRLIHARMSGWGQDGPQSQRAAHDINILAMSGLLSTFRRQDQQPTVPLNLVADYGGGSMFLIAGILAALYERERSGLGQVIDVAMIDGVVNLGQAVWSRRARGDWSDRVQDNIIDGGAPFYDTYRCADGGYIAVGALEPAFYDAWVSALGLDATELPDRWDRNSWPILRDEFATRVAQRTRDEWIRVFADRDACVSPVLSVAEALADPALDERGSFVDAGGSRQAGSAPRFERTPGREPALPDPRESNVQDVLADWAAS